MYIVQIDTPQDQQDTAVAALQGAGYEVTATESIIEIQEWDASDRSEAVAKVGRALDTAEVRDWGITEVLPG